MRLRVKGMNKSVNGEKWALKMMNMPWLAAMSDGFA
jgi:hypothetical protein